MIGIQGVDRYSVPLHALRNRDCTPVPILSKVVAHEYAGPGGRIDTCRIISRHCQIANMRACVPLARDTPSVTAVF